MVSKIAIQAGAVGFALLLIISIVGGAMAYQQVPEGHQGVEKNWGAVSGNTLEPGANWIIPIQQDVQNVEVRPRTYTMTNSKGEGERKDADAVTVKTANGSSVDVSITVRYSINDEQADQFVTVWNNEKQMEKRLIRPTVKTNLQDEGSSLQTTGPGSIYTNEGREALRQTTKKALENEVKNQPITIEAVQIRAIDLPEAIDETLDKKEQAKQQVEVEKQQVKQAEAEAEAQIVRAEADAEAIEIRGEALEENPIVLKQRYIEALKEGDTIYVPTESGGITLTREADGNSTDDDGGN